MKLVLQFCRNVRHPLRGRDTSTNKDGCRACRVGAWAWIPAAPSPTSACSKRPRAASRSGRCPRRPDDPSRGIAQGVEEGMRRVAPRRATAGGARQLFRPRHDGRHQCADPAQAACRPASSPPTASATCSRSAGRSGRTSTTSSPTSRRRWSTRDLRLEVAERVRHDGEVETPLDEDARPRRGAQAARGRRQRGRDLLPLRLRAARARATRASEIVRRSIRKPSSARATRSRPSSASSSGSRPRW